MTQSEVDVAGREVRVRARREELLDACDRVVRRAGAEATMTDMATEAGITKLVLYRHFGDKGGVHRALAERWTAPVLASVDAVLSTTPPGRELIERTLDAYLAFVEAEPGPYRFLMDPASVSGMEVSVAVSDLVARIADEVAAVVATGTGASRERSGTWGAAIVGAVQVAGDRWLADTDRRPRAEVVEDLTALLWPGFVRLVTRGSGARQDSTG
jgi:AcrR family transcriptional regulator